MKRLSILIMFSFLIVQNGFSQNEITLNDSIKEIYKHELTLSIEVLKVIERGNYNDVFNILDNPTVDKGSYSEYFKQIKDLIKTYGFPLDSLVTFQQTFLKIPSIMDKSEYLEKTISFNFRIKDSISKDNYNNIWIRFRSRNEKDFISKTHDYKLSEIYFDSASKHKKMQESIDEILNRMK